MTHAVIYARVSSKEQEREGYSIPAQLELLREYANRQGFNVLKEFSEAETAKTAGREQFSQMLAFARLKSGPKIILVEKTDRLYRNWKDYAAVEDLMNEHGVYIHLVKEGEILGKDAQSHVKFIHGIKALMAKNYIDNLSEETRKGMLQKAKEGGWPVAPPYGYHMSGGLLIPHPDQADFVRTAFQKYATGLYSIKALAQSLRKEGYHFLSSTPTVPKSTLERMLKRRVYIGDVEFKGNIYPGKHQPLVAMDIWIRVQQAFKKDNKPMIQSKHTFRYRGIFACGECGSILTGDAKKDGKYIYYRCTRSSNQDGCTQKHISEAVIDKAVTEIMSQLEIPPSFKEDVIRSVQELDTLKREDEEQESTRLKRKLDGLRRRLRAAYEDKLAGNIDEDMWRQVSKDYKDQIDEIECRIAQVAQADLNYYELANTLLELPEKLSQSWFRASEEQKGIFMKLIYSNCIVKDGKPLIELHPVFDY